MKYLSYTFRKMITLIKKQFIPYIMSFLNSERYKSFIRFSVLLGCVYFFFFMYKTKILDVNVVQLPQIGYAFGGKCYLICYLIG